MHANAPGTVLQLQPGTNVETTSQTRIVHTNRGPMVLVPLATEGSVMLPSSSSAGKAKTGALVSDLF